MSDKDIKIGIGVSGAEKATSEISKVSGAFDAMEEARAKAAADSLSAGDDSEKAARRLEYELRKAQAATVDLGKDTVQGFDGMLKSAEKVESQVKSTTSTVVAGAKKVQEAVREIGQESEKVNREEKERAKEQAKNVTQIRNQVIAQSLGLVNQYAGEASRKIREYSESLAEIDPKAAADIAQVADGFDMVSASAQGAALGMMALGPPGAVIGAVVAPAMGELGKEVDSAVESFEKLKEAEKIAAEMPKRIEKANQALIVKEQQESWKALRLEMEKVKLEADAISAVTAAQMNQKVLLAEQKVKLAEAGDGDPAKAKQELKDAEAARFYVGEAAKVSAAQNAVGDANRNYEDALRFASRDTALNSEEQQRMAKDVEKYRAELEKATINLRRTNELSAISKENFQATSQTQDRLGVIEKEKQSQGVTVEGINQLVDAIGDNGSKDLQGAIRQLSAFAADKKLDADELQKANTLLRQFSNQIINLFQKQTGILENANGKIQELFSKFDQLQRDMNNAKINATQGVGR